MTPKASLASMLDALFYWGGETESSCIRRNMQNAPHPNWVGAAKPTLRGNPMAKMCPATGCKTHSKMCMHEKLMIGMGALVVLGGIAVWGLQLI